MNKFTCAKCGATVFTGLGYDPGVCSDCRKPGDPVRAQLLREWIFAIDDIVQATSEQRIPDNDLSVCKLHPERKKIANCLLESVYPQGVK